ncbi:hypothetical protein FACS1894188_05500 [Clostridia bacterium]|nr:hypothetical protein FACS1894188_05500 [Clostridia bacterium]
MAKTGLKRPVCVLLNETQSTPSYSGGMVVGKAISANISIEINETLLYADDGVAESVKAFKSGKISLNTDDIVYEVQGFLLGHTVTANSLTANANDVAPHVGVGFYGSVIRSGVTKFRAIWLYKVKFGECADESKTKGESIESTTPTIEGTIMQLSNGDWKTEQIFETEAAAVIWLNSKAGITEDDD